MLEACLSLISSISRSIRQHHMARYRASIARSTALAFNRDSAYSWSHPRWMCPSCNAIHNSTGTSAWSGLQYPACCDFPAGGRLEKRFATGVRR